MTRGRQPITMMIGEHAHLAPLRADTARLGRLQLSLAPHTGPISAVFNRMIADQPFDFCEMAASTFLQARSLGFPLVLVPVVVMARSQHDALVYKTSRGSMDQTRLAGTRVAIRSYAQTTGVWLRGMLHDETHLGPEDVTWLTLKPSHIPGVDDPVDTIRITDGRRTADILADEEADVAIVGPEDIGPGQSCVFGDAEAADKNWISMHGTIPVNHVLVARDDPQVLARIPEIVELFTRVKQESEANDPDERSTWLRANGHDPQPIGLEAMVPSLTILMRYCIEQGFLPEGSDLQQLVAAEGPSAAAAPPLQTVKGM